MYKFICIGCNVFFPDHFIYIYVFILAVLDLCAARELLSRCATQPAHFSGFSCCGGTSSGSMAFGSCGARAPGSWPSAAADHGLRAHGLRQLRTTGSWVHGLRQLRTTGSWVHGLQQLRTTGSWVHGLRQLRTIGSWVHGLWQLWTTGSRHPALAAVARGLGGCGPRGPERGLSSCSPRFSCSQFEPMPPALADGLFTTEPPGKEALVYFLY